jgi:hypothetical protein
MKSALFVFCLAAAPSLATAAKSNQVRPTPSPILRPGLRSGELVLSPEAVYANYTDNIESGLPDFPHHYDITSAGLVVHAQYGLSDRLHLDLGVEHYRKFGTITGPSPADPSQLVEAHVLGSATKIGLQADLEVLARRTNEESQPPRPFDFAAYVFAKALGDIFRQDQNEPLAQTQFAENGLVYRAGAAVHLHLTHGLFVAPFGGVEGLRFSGERTDTLNGDASTSATEGSDLYPFFGGDLLWAPPQLGGTYDQALSLGAIWSLAAEDDSGYGGKLVTFSLGWSFTF